MTKSIKSSKPLVLFLSLMMMVTTAFAFGGIEASAATLSAPSVTLTNSSTTSIKVSWKKVTNAKKYTVYRSTKSSSGFKAIATTTSTSFNSTKLTCGKKYYFKVKAINGSTTKMSAVKSKTCAPAKVTGLKVSSLCSGLNVSWSKVSGASGYQIYYATSSTGSFKSLKTTTALSYKHANIGLGKTRYYKVRAYKTVSGKKVYGDFCAVVSKKTAHVAASSWTITKKATCAATGTKTNTCKYCKKKYSVTIPKDTVNHNYIASDIDADDVYEPYKQYKCKTCGYTYTSTKREHKYNTYTVAATCTDQGYTYDECKNCERVANIRDIVPSTGKEHVYGETTVDEKTNFSLTPCTKCSYVKVDRTCYIDLTNQTVSNPNCAQFKYSSTKIEAAGENEPTGAFDKLDLNYLAMPDPNKEGKMLAADFEITGEATDLTIDVNTVDDIDIKLAGASIINADKDCIDIKNKAAALEDGTVPTPEVSLSIKDATENHLEATTSGNAIETSCELSIKGHGSIDMITASTTINAGAKINLKNATVNIQSANRGIDTKTDILNEKGLIMDTVYYNVKIEPNAKLKIESADDCIRAKNMEITALAEGDVDSVIVLSSKAGDGVQIEGKTGFTANSGDITIRAGKYAFNCPSNYLHIADNSKVDAVGGSGYSKPEKIAS